MPNMRDDNAKENPVAADDVVEAELAGDDGGTAAEEAVEAELVGYADASPAAVDAELVDDTGREPSAQGRPSVRGRKVARGKAGGPSRRQAGDGTRRAGSADAVEDASPDSSHEDHDGAGSKGEGAAEKGTADASGQATRAASRRRARRIVIGIIVGVLAVAIVAAGLFCWQKWLRYDDASDIRGEWRSASTGGTIVFDGRDLKLTKGISYAYELDTDEKTIAFSFGELSGGGRYYFNDARDTLIIVEGGGKLGLLAEIGFLPEDLLDGEGADEGVTVLSKVSDDVDAEPSGTAIGISGGSSSGEREYVAPSAPSESSSSSGSSRDEDDDSDSAEFVDDDGDGYDDETGLDHDEFSAQFEDEDGEGDEWDDGDWDDDASGE